MKIIVPAYNVKPDQAARFEVQIATIMHRERERELSLFKKTDQVPDAVKVPRHTRPPKRTDIATPKPLNPTDSVILRILGDKELTATEIADWLAVSSSVVRQSLSKLYTRDLVSRRRAGLLTVWRSCAGQTNGDILSNIRQTTNIQEVDRDYTD